MATDLGKAYVQIMPSAKGISGSIQKIVNPEAAAAGKSAGSTIASNMSKSLGKAGKTLTKFITTPVVGATAAVSGLVGALGFKRLVGLDTAQAKLKGLGYNAEEVERISGQVETAIMGGMTTMGEGVDIAAGALAAGVKEGAELERYIKLVGDAAVGANRPVDEMAQIFNRVQGGGRLMTQELNMIEMGLPGFSQAMADELAGGSMEAFREMVTNGQVGSDEFLNVMDDFAGGMAGAYSESWAGMAKNTLAYVGIIGEALLEGLFEDGKKGLAELIEVLQSDEIQQWAVETGEKIREIGQSIVEFIKGAIDWWTGLSDGMQTFIMVIGGIVVALGPVLMIASKIAAAIPIIVGAFKILGVVIAALTSPIGLVIAAVIGAATLIFIYWEPIKDFFINLWETIKDITINTWDALKNAWNSSVDILKNTWDGISSFFASIWKTTKDIFMVVWEPIKVVWVEVSGFVREVWGDLSEFFSELWADIKEVMIEVWEPIKVLWTGIVDFFIGLWEFLVETITIVWDIITEIFTLAWATITDIVMTAVNVIVEVLNTAWDMIVIHTTTVFEVMKTILQTAWEVVVTIVQTALDVLMEVIVSAWDIIKTVITTTSDIVKGIIQTVWNVIKGIIRTALKLIKGDVSGAWETIKETISSVINSVKGIIQSVWNGIKSIISSVLGGIRSNITSVWNGIKSVVSSVVNAIRNIISSIFNGLRGIVSGAMSGVRNAVSTGISGALNAVTNFVGRFKDAGRRIVTSIADGIKGAVGKVTGAISNVAGKIRDFLPFSPPKTGPLIDIMDVDWGGTIGGGILKGESVVAKAMEELLNFDVPDNASLNYQQQNAAFMNEIQQPQPIYLQVDGVTFAQIMGDYTSAEGGRRIRRIERGLA